MQKLGRKSFAGLVATIVATTCLGFAAGGSHKSSERATDVTFINMAKFKNGETLPAGTYVVEVPKGSQRTDVTFYKDGKAVATIKANLVAQEKKNPDTEVESITQGNAELVTAIRPAGWNETLMFGSAGEEGSPNAGQ